MYITAYFFDNFPWVFASIKVKFGRRVVYIMTNISTIFLVQFWRLRANSEPFYDSSKIDLQQSMLIFKNGYVPFLIVSVHPLKKVNEKLYSIRTWLLSNCSLFLN